MGDPNPPLPEGQVLWQPSAEIQARTRMSHYRDWLEQRSGASLPDYPALWQWSVREIEKFWDSIVEYFGVTFQRQPEAPLSSRLMPGAVWFPGATLNYAEHALRTVADDELAIIAVSEGRPEIRLTGQELRRQVASLAGALRAMGISPGDRVAAYLPNIPEAVISCLAAASVGAIWSSCSPDFGESAVLDRFRQISPRVLIATDGYVYGGRVFDRRGVVETLRAELPSLEQTILVPYLGSWGQSPAAATRGWADLTSGQLPLEFESVDFSHPLWILYSSGTTGLPKPIVHSHGGILVEHLKVLGLHQDLGPGDRSFWFTTTGWMMWNYLIGGLLVGATVVLYDGSPAYPGIDRLWRLAADLGVTHLGTSAGHLAACAKQGLEPAAELDLGRLRFVGSTGSPLSADSFAWVYRAVGEDLWLASLSGGTDLCTAFVLGCPWLPVRSGVIQCRALGALVQAFDPDGRSLEDQVGELVITEPMPSMPVAFWGDPEGVRLRESYFEMFPGVWRHGDWVRILGDGGVVISGRSDSTINRHGIRMGTSEIYRVVEQMDEVSESLVLEVERPDGTSYMPLFVALSPGVELDQGLIQRLRARLREQISPRHVPDLVMAVPGIPKTLNGKKLEVPIKRILEGADPAAVVNRDSIQDPELLRPFLALAPSHQPKL